MALSIRHRAHALLGRTGDLVGDAGGWYRFRGYIRKRKDGERSFTGADHTALVRALESTGAEVEGFDMVDVGERTDLTHTHALLDHDVYAAMLGVIKEADGFFQDGLTLEDRTARIYTTRQAIARYKDSQHKAACQPPHPQIEGPGWRHY